MTSTTIRAAATAIFGAVLGGGLACSAILTPRDDVDRCGNTDDCPTMADTRYRYECRFDPESSNELDSLNVDKVCVPSYAPFGCALPDDLDDPYRDQYDRRKRAINYTHCADSLGAQGCPPDQGACNEGLSPRAEDGICDDDDPSTPPAFAQVTGTDTDLFFGQDVRDQYCRSFYCDARFVCDTRDNQCRLCEPGLPIGEGGCGEIYSGGKSMCTYQGPAELEAACAAPSAGHDTIQWGECAPIDPGPSDDTGDIDETDGTTGPGDTGDEGTTGDLEDTDGTTGDTEEPKDDTTGGDDEDTTTG
jgi:hypothetical protein